LTDNGHEKRGEGQVIVTVHRPKGREEMVRAVVDCGLSKAEVARRYDTTPKTVRHAVRLFSRPARPAAAAGHATSR
jgi:transposase-like protein